MNRLSNPRQQIEDISGNWEAVLSQSLAMVVINRFNQEGVLYCHWKSNIDLPSTFEGELDMDLLVANGSLAAATDVLMQLGFKQATSRWGPNPPGIFHYYGYDPRQNNLVHLHLFTRVLTGESFLKSHLLPFEEMLLKNASFNQGMRVTSKEAELVLFVLRTYIKYGSFLDAVRLLRSEKKVQEEARWLKEGSDIDQVVALLDTFCPVVSKEIFLEGLAAILNQAAFSHKWLLSYRMRRRLRPYRKYSFPGWLSGHLQLLAGTLIKKLRKQKGSKILLSGGTIVAIVGADATGKSTTVSETNRWLRKNFVVNTIHAGKPPSTLLTIPVNFLLALQRRRKRRSPAVRNPEQDSSRAKAIGLSSLIYAARAVCLAWDRLALLSKASRAAAHGEMVVCDRYPTRTIGLMDSPRLVEDPSQKGWVAALYNRLARSEQALYRQIPPPDIVLKLRVSVETAKQRNAAREVGDDEVYLQQRHQQAGEWFMPGTRCIQEIDTERPLAETLLAVKQAIWSAL